jgi:hypothetical protein
MKKAGAKTFNATSEQPLYEDVIRFDSGLHDEGFCGNNKIVKHKKNGTLWICRDNDDPDFRPMPEPVDWLGALKFVSAHLTEIKTGFQGNIDGIIKSAEESLENAKCRVPASKSGKHEVWNELVMTIIATTAKMAAVAVIVRQMEQNTMNPEPEIQALIQIGDEFRELAPKLHDQVYGSQPSNSWRSFALERWLTTESMERKTRKQSRTWKSRKWHPRW